MKLTSHAFDERPTLAYVVVQETRFKANLIVKKCSIQIEGQLIKPDLDVYCHERPLKKKKAEK